MSCVLDILSIEELNTRKEHLLKQLNKVEIEIMKRNGLNINIQIEENNKKSIKIKVKKK
jgi:hypothetical protein